MFANALTPEGVEQSNWRELLSDDLREPTIKTPVVEAVSRRLRRVYLPLISVLVAAWFVRLSLFATSPPGLVLITFWPGQRQAKGELQSRIGADEWK